MFWKGYKCHFLYALILFEVDIKFLICGQIKKLSRPFGIYHSCIAAENGPLFKFIICHNKSSTRKIHYFCPMIFYLSSTGNSKWVASFLKEKTSEELIDITKVSKKEKLSYHLKEDERIGFCFPTHGWRVPLILRDFIKRLFIDNASGHFCYAITTAGDTIGETIKILKKDLQQVNIHLDSAYTIIMPESYVGLPFMDVDTKEKEALKKQKAFQDLNMFSNEIIERKKDIYRLVRGRWKKINTWVLGGLFIKYLITDKPFKVTIEKCSKCGKCAKACPISNISWETGNTPHWKHTGDCLSCFACYHHCPNHAIEYGGRTKNKGQYFFDLNKED